MSTSIPWVSVSSSLVKAIAHIGGKLYIRFKGGEEAEYDNVPREVYRRMLASASKGKFVWRVIRGNGRDNVYTFRYLP